MANSYKDIIITPNRSNTAEPKIEFRGANTTVNTAITMQTYPTSNGTLSFEGSAGQLFSITNDLTGSIFSVNDVSGIPSIEVFANGQINMAQYGGNIVIGSGVGVSANGSYGTAGQMLASNGTSIYWLSPQIGDITAVTAGNGLTGGGTSGDLTLNIGAGTGIIVNGDDIAVNSSYIATISANNTVYLGGYSTNYFLRADGEPASSGTDWNTLGDDVQTINQMIQNHFNVGGGSGNSNFPTVAYNYGTLVNFGVTGLSSRSQLFISHAGNDMIFRGGWGTASWQSWNKVWTNLTDGSGSGLDADLLDGSQGSEYVIKFISLGDTDLNTLTDSGFYRLNLNITNAPSGHTNYGNMIITRGADTMTQIYSNYNNARMWVRKGSGVGTGTFSSPSAWYEMWNSGNDGSGSGLDADLLDGLHSQQLFNNFGSGHTTFTDFNSVPDFGNYFVQGTTNGPGTGSSQFFVNNTGIGSDYGYGNYALQMAIGRFSDIEGSSTAAGARYLSVRNREATAWQPWYKIASGLSDKVGYTHPAQSGGGQTYTGYGPEGGGYWSGASSSTGAVRIRLPGGDATHKNAMISFTVRVFGYSPGTSFDINIAGYTYDAGLRWVNCSASLVGDPSNNIEHTVRFGYDEDSARFCVYIGETGSVWSYPRIQVLDVGVHYGQEASNKWIDGWNVDFVTSFSTVTVTRTNTAVNKYFNGSTIWNAGNDGSGSGLDADTLDGLNLSLSQAVSTVVGRDSSGYVYLNYINSDTGNAENPAIGNIITTNTTDGFYRKSSLSHLATSFGGQSITWSGIQYFLSNKNTGPDAAAPLQAYSNDNSKGAIMSFHRSGQYAVNMGLDSDNVFRIGGWSASANVMQLTMAGNVQFLGKVTAAGASGFSAATYAVNVRNPIYRFDNADGFGLSYFQGTAGYISNVDTIGLHFGTATAAGAQHRFLQNGNAYISGNFFAEGGNIYVREDPAVGVGLRIHHSGSNAYFDTDGTYNFRTAGGGELAVIDASGNFSATAAVFGTRFATGYDSGVTNSVSCSNWFRTNGDTGIFFASYGGGVYMIDTTWVRVYNSKAFYVGNEIAATGNITAYYSDDRFKTRINTIDNALDKVSRLSGFIYKENDLAKSLGYSNNKQQAGVSAQDVQAVLPEAVSLAPIDYETLEDGTIVSKSGEDYLTVDYSRLVPLLIEAIKELKTKVDDQQKIIDLYISKTGV